eukprot:TRINITY_DN77_c0_g1_i7.p1 TRINITY_DN77_c0_g1~~TRINITY_DN77_c0_g1_i7.p1  ORF type:complete len:1146 (-),score=233.47 TRINITY_DN77_c0_g1_i7:29-3466(-)
MWISVCIVLLYFQSILCLTCNNSEYACEKSNVCIPITSRCDQRIDCAHEEDEADCKACTSDERRCRNGHQCVDAKFWCDGFADCSDDSDEGDHCTSIQRIIHQCPEDHVRCNSTSFGFCIPTSFLCDGTENCVDGEDEKNCDVVTDGDCPSPSRRCLDGACMPGHFFCDGEVDCMDGSDESDCPDKVHHTECLVSEGKYACKREFNHTLEVDCIDASKLCDGTPHCPLGDDEGFCTKKACDNHCDQLCAETPTGPECYCHAGYKLSEDGINCEDIDECQTHGVCDQICINNKGGFECDCVTGYTLYGKSHCQYTAGTAQIYIASYDSASQGEIRVYDPVTKEYLLPLQNLSLPVGVGYYAAEHALVWTDAHDGHPAVEIAVNIGHEGMMKQYTLVETGLEAPEDLVVDEISDVVYFTDSEKGTVSACSLLDADDVLCSVISKNHFQPRGLAIHSKRKMLFVTEYGEEAQITRMNQDGSDALAIIQQEITWPNGVAVDEPIDRIFWTDGHKNTIESANIDGKDRRVIVEDDHHPFGIVVFEDKIYWTDWRYYRLRSANKFTGKNIETTITSNKWRLFGIHIHLTGQSAEESADPCDDNNCSHLCLPSGPDRYACKCPEHMYLGLSTNECQDLPMYQSKMMVSSGNSIYSLVPQHLGLVNLETVGYETGVVQSVSSETIENNLIAVTRDGNVMVVNTDLKFSNQIASGLDIKSISYDNNNYNIFWIDNAKKSVMIMSETTKALKTIVNCTQPKALHYVHDKHRIAFIDGANLLETSMTGENYLLVSDLPADVSVLTHFDNAYYFADKHFIYKYTENSASYLDLVRVNREPLSLVVQDGYLYWTQQGDNKLYWIDLASKIDSLKVNSLTLKTIDGNTMHLSASKFFVDKSIGACSKKYCSDICIVTEEDKARCLCGDDSVMVQDDHWTTCKKVDKPSDVTTSIASLSNSYISLLVCLIVGLVLTVLFLCGCCIVKSKRESGNSSMQFFNRSFGISPRRTGLRNQEMSPVNSFKSGTLNEIYNPGCYTVDLPSSVEPTTTTTPTDNRHRPLSASFIAEQERKGLIPSIMKSLRKLKDPKNSRLDTAENSSYESLISAKGSSTPNISVNKRKLDTINETDSACSIHSGQNSFEDDMSTTSSDTAHLVCRF